MSSWAKDSWTWGALPGGAFAGAAAAEMLSANSLTINPLSSAVLVVTWVATGVVVGFAVGWLGGRFARILRRDFVDGAIGMSVLTVGHLLLPVAVGFLAAAALLLLRRLRLRWFPRLRRLDLAMAGAVAAWTVLVPLSPSALPPPEDAGVPLPPATPLPGSVPVTISVHTEREFPEVPAIHLPLRPLASQEPGRRAALWSGRLPDRTRVGRHRPRLLGGGGGISRLPEAPGARWLAEWFPSPASPEGTAFETTGTLAALATSSGIPVLHTPPSEDDPPHYLRILDGARAPDLDTARRLRSPGAWIDVTLEPEGGRVALSGTGLLLARASGHVNLVDVAPTVLHLLGLPVPRACDGRVLLELMESPGPGSCPPRYRALSGAPRDDDVSELTTSR